MNHFTQAELNEDENIVFNNESRQWEDAFEIEVIANHERSVSPFHIWTNGQLTHTFHSFTGLRTRAEALIAAHDLERAA